MNILDMSARMQRGDTISRADQLKLVFALSLPAILEQICFTLMEYIDAIMVGSLGANATAAVGVVTSTLWLMNGIIAAVSVGFSVQIAQYLGAGRAEDARQVLRQTLLFNVLFGAFLALISPFLGKMLPVWLGAEEALHADATAYYTIVGLFLPMTLAGNLYSSALRCAGNVRAPSLISLLMCLLNVLFNFFLIFPAREVQVLGMRLDVWGAGLGVSGAALGTGLSTTVTALMMLWIAAFREESICLHPGGHWRFTRLCLKNALLVGTPVALERATLCLAQILLTTVITRLGTVSVAAHYLAVTAESICYMPCYGIAAAATTLVGQSIGADRRDMARQFGWLTTGLGFCVMLLTSLCLWLLAPLLLSLFTSDPEVRRLGSEVLRIVAFCEPLFGISIVITGALRGAGDSKGPFYINLLCMWGLRMGVIFLYTGKLGLVAIWISMTVELCFRGAIFLLRLARGRWLQTKKLA